MNHHPFALDGKVVLLVGASSGIGAATARLVSQLGGRVVLAGRSLQRLEPVKASLADPHNATTLEFDYLDPRSLGAALSSLERIDHVVIPAVADENAKRGRFLDLSDETMRASFNKYWGQVNVLRATARKMPPGGSFVLFSSTAGLKPTGAETGLSVMNGVQAAVIQTGRSLALELAPLRVNVIAPGVVLTNVWSEEQRHDLKAWMESTLPARRAGTADDVALAAISLLANPYITGTVLTVDGGLHLT